MSFGNIIFRQILSGCGTVNLLVCSLIDCYRFYLSASDQTFRYVAEIRYAYSGSLRH